MYLFQTQIIYDTIKNYVTRNKWLHKYTMNIKGFYNDIHQG